MEFNIFNFAESINVKLTSEQEKAIRCIDKNIAVVAVPGSGKTAVFVLRLAKLIKENNVASENILALTFSKMAAKDMKKRFDKWCSEIIEVAPDFSTIHSFAYSILQKYDSDFSPRCIIEGETDQNRKNDMIKRIYMNINKEYPSEDIMKNILAKIGYCKNLMINPKTLINENGDVAKFKEIFMEYELQKKVKGFYDFDDLLEKAYLLLKNNSEALSFYQNKYKYIQIDEYQDTSKIQNAIIKTLFNPNTNIFVVGDDDQSIYKFRGASPADFLAFKNIYPNSEVLYMTKNFRSTKNIVESANRFINLNTQRYEKQVSSTRRNGSMLTISATEDASEQCKFVLNSINNKREFGKIAILYRNNVSAIPYIDLFIRNNISFSCYGTKDFFNNSIVKDITAFLTLANNFFDVTAFRSIYMKHFISKEIMEYVCDNITSQKNIFDILIESSEKFFGAKANEKKEIYRRLYFQYKMLKDKRPVLKAIEFIETEFKYLEYLDKKGPKNSLSVSMLKQNLSILKTVANGCTTQIGFMEHLVEIATFTQNIEENRIENPQVYLKTIHSAKGLEWDTVFMVDLINDIFPAITSITKIVENNDYEEVWEERRLFYVGMTRAKNNLFLCYPKRNPDGKFIVPSLFLKELEDVMKHNHSNALENIVESKSNKKKVVNKVAKNNQLSFNDTSTFPKIDLQNNELISKEGNTHVLDLNIGDVVFHKNPILGEGKVVELNTSKNSIKINFNGTIKTYALDYCFKLNLLSKK